MERNDLIEKATELADILRTRAGYARSEGDATAIGDALHFEGAADTIATLSEALAEAENKALERAAEAVRVLSYKQGTNSPAWISLRQAEDRIRNLPAPPRDLSQGGQHG